MSQLQDMTGDDLKRFMYDEPQDNIEDIRMTVKNRLVETESVKIIPLTRKVRKKDLFSSSVNRKISRVRPGYAARLVGLFLCGFAFGMIAAISAVMIDYPYNLVLVSISLAPIAMTVIRMMRHGYRVNGNKRELL